jgi:hypothetical protein
MLQLQTPKPPQIFNHHPNIHSPTSAANPRQAQSGRVQRLTLLIAPLNLSAANCFNRADVTTTMLDAPPAYE